jgi:hypothetical protein
MTYLDAHVYPSTLLLSWQWDPNDVSYDDYTELYLAGPVSAGRTLTLHDAKRIGYAGLLDGELSIARPAAGSYSFWARDITSGGLAGPWSTLRFEVPA